MKSCYLCGRKSFKKRRGKVRDKPDIKILECTNCGLVFLDRFDHISDDFYEESGMHGQVVSVENWLHETAADDERRINLLKRMIENRALLDFGCGNGGFLMLARDYASSAEGVELERNLESHFKQNNLTVYRTIEEIDKKYDIITAFHVVEHLKDPALFLRKLATLLSDDGMIVIEVPNSADALLTLYKSKAFSEFTYWSCHLFLFNSDNLKLLAQKAGLEVIFLKQVQRYPLSNHLHWLARGKPGGHQKWWFLNSETLNSEYEKVLSSLGICDTIMACFTR